MAKVASGNFACADSDTLVATDEYGAVGFPGTDKAVGVETLAGNGDFVSFSFLKRKSALYN